MFHKLLAALLLVCQTSLAMDITCAAFQSLPQVTYNNVQSQAQVRLIVSFAEGTSRQVLDAYRDALTCRGGMINTPNYNTLSLVGYASSTFANQLRDSPDVVSLEYDSSVSTAQHMSTRVTMGNAFDSNFFDSDFFGSDDDFFGSDDSFFGHTGETSLRSQSVATHTSAATHTSVAGSSTGSKKTADASSDVPTHSASDASSQEQSLSSDSSKADNGRLLTSISLALALFLFY
ncbi:hypothetical protein LPJ57_001962 [Coemansia sp. RSA 486]|nr:hypothetical protein LPJ57_001962 [Coemansia sp. RSA 486]KAJ2238458.1 hypothetical protein IWW45_000078 [Coemansia sp. RSA 485]